MFTYLALVKAGYGTLAELKELDTPELLDIIEFEMITADIEHYRMENARNGGR
ncbi:MAG: hypothetical protein RBR37_05495 [Advenella sp.]|jgi:hypothetical protein|nr:hypothetical protein [Advenella sp.]